MAGESSVEYVNDGQKKFAPELSDFISDVARKLVAVVFSLEATSHGFYNCAHRSLGTRILLWSVPSSSLINKTSAFSVFVEVSAEDIGSLVRPEDFIGLPVCVFIISANSMKCVPASFFVFMSLATV